MSKIKRALLTVVCAGALVVGSAAATVAYLTSEDSVKNTFTVGDVAITLDEGDTDGDSNVADNVTVDGVVRDKANKYHLIPGKTFDKDPTVHVGEGSEDCWLFVRVENEIAGIEEQADGKSIVSQMTANGWSLVQDETNVYAYERKVSAGEDVNVFETFTIAGETVDNAELAEYETGADGHEAITVTAYAVQFEGFGSADAAWDAAFGNK